MMNHLWKTLLVGLAATTVIACGGDDDDDASGEQSQTTIECGEDTVPNEDTGECEPREFECDDDQVHDAVLGRCVRAGDSYCGEGTELDEQLGTCVADADLVCGDNTVEESGQCVTGPEKSCGEGTVVHQRECLPADDVCAEGTEHVATYEACRPVEGVCGEGTTFDVSERICVPTSTISCGTGTVADDDHICIPTRAYYEDLAADPDLDMIGEDAIVTIELADPGESFVILGNIDAPQLINNQYIQDEDVYHLDATAGQWLRITVYSLGLPEPLFAFGEHAAAEPFFRLSDLGAGIETTREILVQSDAGYRLTVANLPQYFGNSPPAGGEDWNYVAVVETMTQPEPSTIGLSEEMTGEVGELSNQFYAFEDTDEIDSMALITHLVPQHAETELQVWSEDMTLQQVTPLEDGVFPIEPPGDVFYLLFDHVHAFGDNLLYSMSLQQGTSLEVGESYTKELDISAGQYVGLVQDNLDNAPLSATISDESGPLAQAETLEVSNATEDPISLYWYASQIWADEFDTVTIEVENTSGQDLPFVSVEHFVNDAGDMGSFDGEPTDFDSDHALSRGHRHYLHLEVDVPQDLVRISLADANQQGRISLWSTEGEELEEITAGRDAIVFEDQPGPTSYLIAVEALSTMGAGFTLHLEQTDILEFSQTNNPNVEIPDNNPAGVDDIIDIGGCNNVAEINMDIEINHGWRGDLVVRLTNPAGESRALKARPGTGVFGDSNPDIIGNFNETLDPVAGDPATTQAEPIANFIDGDGNGEWVLNVSDNAGGTVGTLNSWTLNLTCDG